MRIATWNLERPKPRSWKKRPAIEAQIKKIKADIWVLTETHECIRPEGAVDVASSKPVANLYDNGETRTTIWSRWSIRKCLTTHNPERAVCVEIKADEADWIVYGTVMPYLRYGGKVHDESIEQHVKDWVRLTQEYPGHRIVVAGDFNESLDPRMDRYHYGTANGRRLLRQGLTEAGLNCVTQTVDIEVPLGKKANIDHICLDRISTSRTQPVETWEPISDDGVVLSDHIGLFVDVLQAEP